MRALTAILWVMFVIGMAFFAWANATSGNALMFGANVVAMLFGGMNAGMDVSRAILDY